MILTGQLLLPDGERSVRPRPGWLRIDGERIEAVEVGGIHPSPDAGDADTLVSPGFIDPHLHLPQIDAFGGYGLRLLEWLERSIFPAEAAWRDPARAEIRCRSALRQLWAVGTTSVFAFATNHRESTRRALRLCGEAGMRARIGQPLSDRSIHPDLLQSERENLDDLEHLLDEFPERPGVNVSAAVAPRFAPTCGPGLLHGCGELARARGAFVATHLAENEPECELAVALHGGPDYTSVYGRAGLLGPRSFLGHCIHLSPSEQRLLAETESVAVHCPTSNLFLRSGTMNRAAWLRAGIRCGLASDISAGFEKSMIRTARTMLAVTFEVGEAPPSAAEAWWQITRGNARLMEWEDCGEIAPGNRADLVLLKPFHDWRHTADPLSDLLWSWDDRWLERTLLAGRTVYPETSAKFSVAPFREAAHFHSP